MIDQSPAVKSLALLLALAVPSNALAGNLARTPARFSAGARVPATDLKLPALRLEPGIDSFLAPMAERKTLIGIRPAETGRTIAPRVLIAPAASIGQAETLPQEHSAVDFAFKRVIADRHGESPLSRLALRRLPGLLERFAAQWKTTFSSEDGQAPVPTQPSAPEAPRQEIIDALIGEPALSTPASPDAVASSKRVAELVELANADPAAAAAKAVSILKEKGEKRLEVRIGALRVLQRHADSASINAFLEVLRGDKNWYMVREAARSLGLHAALAGQQREALLAALRQAYHSPNPSVGLMAGWSLRQHGVDPGPEPTVELPPSETESQAKAPEIPQVQIRPQRALKLPSGNVVMALVGVGAFIYVVSLFAPAVSSAVMSALIFIGVLMGVQWYMNKRRAAGVLRNQPGGIGPNLNDAKRGQAQLSQTKNRAQRTTARFSDVAGIDDAMGEIRELVDYLRNPDKYKRLGARIPRGVLLEGPAGTGKTLLAKALATESGAQFFSVSGSDFVEMYVGVGASRVRALFEQAKQFTPAIIFIDELDAVGKKRDSGKFSGSNDEREQTLNAILTEMDGFDTSNGVIVIAATNRSDVLDPAIVRPGRFDRKIHVGLPDVLGREAILQVHARRARLSPEADLQFVAKRTAGLSGAYLENIINEAALLAARRGLDAVTAAELNEAVDRNTIGAKRNLFVPAPLKLRIARHETGHALVGLFATGKRPNRVTVIPHGANALGWAESGGDDDRFLYTETELKAMLATIMGGLAAEKVYYGDWSTGPDNDLEKATAIARMMIERLGMSQSVGFGQASDSQNPMLGRRVSEQTAREIDIEVKRLLDEAYAQATKIIVDHQAAFDGIVGRLIERETISGEEIERFVGR